MTVCWMTEAQFLEGTGKGFFGFVTASRLALGPTQPSIQRVLESVSRGKALEA